MNEDQNKNEQNKDKPESAGNPEEIKKERDEYLDGWQRARAELINYKKDELKRFQEMAKFANESVLREIIAVLDSFDLALMALEKDGKAEKGIYLIKAQLEDILKNSRESNEVFYFQFLHIAAAVRQRFICAATGLYADKP